LENGSIIAEAINQAINGIQYTFTQWSDASTVNPRTFSPTNHSTYTAQLSGKPVQVSNISGTEGSGSITLQWQQHPCSLVSYQIWRIISIDGTDGASALLTTLSNGTTSWTDVDWNYAKMIPAYYSCSYDIRALYVSGSTSVTADPNYVLVWSLPNARKTKDIVPQQADIINEKPTSYSIQNYPNPFNPSTNFEIQLPESGNVKLAVYDITGKEVERLVDKFMNAGTYNIKFSGNNIPSGTYMYRLSTNKYNKVGKLLLLK
jgi:hypothetical protein